MELTCLLVANRSRARILEIRARQQAPREVADFANPTARVHERDLDSDAAGRFYRRGERQQGHAAAPSENFADRETERFANEIRDYLEHARTDRHFERLWVLASPAFLGLLRGAFPPALLRHVDLELPKDLTTETPAEIVRHGFVAVDARAERGNARG